MCKCYAAKVKCAKVCTIRECAKVSFVLEQGIAVVTNEIDFPKCDRGF